MKTERSNGGTGRTRKRVNKWFIVLGLFAATGLFTWGIAFASVSAAACDVTTGASCKVVGIKTTFTSAAFSWTEGRHSYQRFFCYGIGSPTNCALVSSRASGVKVQMVTGLTPKTKYAFKFYGIYHGKTYPPVPGTFTTDSSICGATLITQVEVNGVVLTPTGDSLENVIAVIAKQSGGAVVQRDTSDASGRFHFDVDPGTYTITLAYPPFTAPAPYTAVVIATKPLTIPDQIMKDAFKIGGTVVASGKGDSLAGAKVTVTKKADNSLVATRVTDLEGHFSVGLKAGDYLFNAAYMGVSLAAPLSVTVSKSTEIPNLSVALGTAIRMKADRMHDNPWSIPGLDYDAYDAKGARLPKQSSRGIECFRTER